MAKIKYNKITPDSQQERALGPSEPNGYPNLYLDDDDMDEIADWEVGKTYEVAVKIKMRSKSDRSLNGGDYQTNANFDVVGYKVLNQPKDVEDMTMDELKTGIKQMPGYGK